jgi:hypothetical protein
MPESNTEHAGIAILLLAFSLIVLGFRLGLRRGRARIAQAEENRKKER